MHNYAPHEPQRCTNYIKSAFRYTLNKYNWKKNISYIKCCRVGVASRSEVEVNSGSRAKNVR